MKWKANAAIRPLARGVAVSLMLASPAFAQVTLPGQTPQDVDPAKRELIAAGRTPVVEEGIVDLMASVVATGRVRVTSDARDAVLTTEVSLVCVGTPSAANGGQDQSAILRLAGEIGLAPLSALRPATGRRRLRCCSRLTAEMHRQ